MPLGVQRNFARKPYVLTYWQVEFIGRVARSSEQQLVKDYNDVHRPLQDRPYASDQTFSVPFTGYNSSATYSTPTWAAGYVNPSAAVYASTRASNPTLSSAVTDMGDGVGYTSSNPIRESSAQTTYVRPTFTASYPVAGLTTSYDSASGYTTVGYSAPPFSATYEPTSNATYEPQGAVSTSSQPVSIQNYNSSQTYPPATTAGFSRFTSFIPGVAAWFTPAPPLAPAQQGQPCAQVATTSLNTPRNESDSKLYDESLYEP